MDTVTSHVGVRLVSDFILVKARLPRDPDPGTDLNDADDQHEIVSADGRQRTERNLWTCCFPGFAH
jgi:hypothetical protein